MQGSCNVHCDDTCESHYVTMSFVVVTATHPLSMTTGSQLAHGMDIIQLSCPQASRVWNAKGYLICYPTAQCSTYLLCNTPGNYEADGCALHALMQNYEVHHIHRVTKAVVGRKRNLLYGRAASQALVTSCELHSTRPPWGAQSPRCRLR